MNRQIIKSLVFCGAAFATLAIIGKAYPSSEYFMVRFRWLIWGLGVGWRHWKLPNFRQSTESEAVSSGVEGAHEGTTVDEKGDSREPEKLNNAQLQTWIAVEMFEDDWDEPRPLWEDLPEADRNSYIKMAGTALRVLKVSQMSPKELDWALAESSLSSPPPGTGMCRYCPAPIFDNGLNWQHGTFGNPQKVFCHDEKHLATPRSPELLPTQLPKEK